MMSIWTDIRRRKALNRAHSGQPFALFHIPKTAGSFLKASLRDPDVTGLIKREGAGLIDVEIVLRMEWLAQDARRALPEAVEHVDFDCPVNTTPTEPAIRTAVQAAAGGIALRDGALALALGYDA